MIPSVKNKKDKGRRYLKHIRTTTNTAEIDEQKNKIKKIKEGSF
jgi:hypothetical protein